METIPNALIGPFATGRTDRVALKDSFYNELGERWYQADYDPVA